MKSFSSNMCPLISGYVPMFFRLLRTREGANFHFWRLCFLKPPLPLPIPRLLRAYGSGNQNTSLKNIFRISKKTLFAGGTGNILKRFTPYLEGGVGWLVKFHILVSKTEKKIIIIMMIKNNVGSWKLFCWSVYVSRKIITLYGIKKKKKKKK